MNIPKILERWDLRNWIFVGFIFQIILIFIAEGIFRLFPAISNQQPLPVSLSTDMSFIEYQEPETEKVISRTKELSETIIEVKKKKNKESINWKNAVDPTLDFTQRYSPRIMVSISPEDYPERAKKAQLGKVKVSVVLYIGADGKIKDVKIRKIHSDFGDITMFRNDFIRAVKHIFLKKSKLLSSPYQINGEYKDFIWYTTVVFTLQ